MQRSGIESSTDLVREIWSQLLESGIDFLRSSLDELQHKPKLSIIHFAFGLELLFKARLMAEHWSLILQDPGSSSISQVADGEFLSVSLDEALRRLQNITMTPISESAKSSFKSVARHRNKVVHFIHPNLNGTAESLAEITKEQLRAWRHFRRLVQRSWAGFYSSVDAEIAQLEAQLRQNRAYLSLVYEELLPAIEKGRLKGAIFRPCGACGFEAARREHVYGRFVFIDKCLVCEFQESIAKFECLSCGSQLDHISRRIGCHCTGCGSSWGFGDLAYLIVGYTAELIYCGNCSIGTSEATVCCDASTWLCLSCLETFPLDQSGSCGRCGNTSVGRSLERSPEVGCSCCEVIQIHNTHS